MTFQAESPRAGLPGNHSFTQREVRRAAVERTKSA